MRITRDFVFEKDQDTGETGLRPCWMANANTTTTIAHDVLEHPSNARLTAVESELQALGTLAVLRMQTGVLPLKYCTPSESMARNVSLVLVDTYHGQLALPSPRTSKALPEDLDWTDKVIDLGVTKGFELARKELAGCDDEAINDLLGTPGLRDTFVALMRQGARQAPRRYQQLDMYTLGESVFTWLNSVSERLCSSEMLSEGSKIRMSIDLARQSINLKVDGSAMDIYGLT